MNENFSGPRMFLGWPKGIPVSFVKKTLNFSKASLCGLRPAQFFCMQLHSSIPSRGRLTPQCLQMSSHPVDVRHCSVTPDHSCPRAHLAMCGGAVTVERDGLVH